MKKPLAVAGLLFFCVSGLSAQDPWWEREPLRIIDVTSDLTRFETQDPAVAAAQKADLGFNAEHLAIMQIAGGLDDGHFFFASQVAGKQNPDYLKRYLPEAHKRGIRVLIYFTPQSRADRTAGSPRLGGRIPERRPDPRASVEA